MMHHHHHFIMLGYLIHMWKLLDHDQLLHLKSSTTICAVIYLLIRMHRNH